MQEIVSWLTSHFTNAGLLVWLSFSSSSLDDNGNVDGNNDDDFSHMIEVEEEEK